MDGQRRALIVANDEYDHQGLQHLRSAAADAEALAGVLGDPQIGGFTVEVARNRPAHDVGAQVEDLFSESRPDDVLLLHFSCHGLKDESGELYFATRNTRPNRLGSTAISANFVQRCMRASRSRSIVLLLDCCYGGAFSQGVTVRASGDLNVLDSFPVGRLGGGRGRAVISASSSIEYAFEGDQLADDHDPRPSVFTAALVEGLATGNADRDEDGWVSLNELYDYVFDRVREQNPHQTPSRDVEMQGELYLARSRRRRIRPLAAPPDLQAAMADSNMFTRLGAASELRSRLTGDNLAAAVGAYAALTEMASTDIRYVAEAAEAALREVAVQPDEQDLQFGQVRQDASPVHRTVRLLGPPIARACTFEPSDRWIRIEETPDGLDVSVDTSRTGDMHGHITVKGPTGEAVIPVHVDVAPRPEPTPAPTPPPTVTRPIAPTASATTPTRQPEPAPPRPATSVHAERRQWWAWVPRTGRSRAIVAGLAILVMAIVTAVIVYRSSDRGQSAGGSYAMAATIRSVAFGPNGKVIATASDDSTVRLWNPTTGQPIGIPLTGHGGAVSSVAFSPDGKLLASGSHDRTVRLWDPTTGRPVRQPLTGHTSYVRSVAFSPDGKLVASASDDQTVRLWDPATGQPVGQPLSGHIGYVRSVAFSPDGKRLASGGDDYTVRMWSPVTGQPIGRPFTSGDTTNVIQVAFSPDGKWLVSTSDRRVLQLWYPTTGDTLVPNAGNSYGIVTMAFSPDGKLFAGAIANTGTVRLWNPTTWAAIGRPLTGHMGEITSLALSPDSKLLAVGASNNTVYLWNPTTGQPVGHLPPAATPSANPSPTRTGP